MKISLLMPILLSAAAVATGANAREEEKLTEQQVPKAVLEAFHKAYPKAEEVEYEKESKDGQPAYEMEFKDQGVEREVTYTAEGKLLKTEQDEGKGEQE